MLQSPKNSALVVACLLGLGSPQALAAEWTTSAGVTPKLVYTDNVCLSANNEQDEVYAEVTPNASITGKGRRANVSLSSSVDVNSLTNSSLEDNDCLGGDSDRDQVMPQLKGTADAILVEQWLFIDADVSSSQNDVNSFRSGGSDRADRTGNTNTTYRYSVSPYVSRRFKNLANLLLRYTYDDQYNTKDVVGDSTQESWALSLGGGPVFSPLTWALQGNYEKTEYSDTPGRPTENNSELKSAQLNLGYQLNRAWQINGYYGSEWNDFVSSNDDIDGSFWDVGVRWTPNARTSVEVGTGDRFFGSTPRLSISHRHKRSNFSANYAKTLTYSRDIRTLDGGGGFDDFGNPTSLSNSPILDERFTLGYNYTGRRASLGLAASHSDQTREGGSDESALVLDESTFKDVLLSLGHPLSSKWSLSGSVRWSEREPKRSASELNANSETWRYNLGADRSLTSNIKLALNYQYTDRQSDNAFDQYQENRITLSVNINLL